MLVCASENDKETFNKNSILDPITYQFKKGIYYIDKKGSIKQYTP